jgi:hypothetical protein
MEPRCVAPGAQASKVNVRVLVKTMSVAWDLVPPQTAG